MHVAFMQDKVRSQECGMAAYYFLNLGILPHSHVALVENRKQMLDVGANQNALDRLCQQQSREYSNWLAPFTSP